MKNIIEMAILDSDQWVSMVGELLKTYPLKGTINFDIEENSSVFNDLINELKKLVKKHNDQSILPIECLYLNKDALSSIIGTIPPPAKHFTLKKNPKSISLRSELLNKSTDAAVSLKRGNVGQPIRNRSGSKDLNDSTPLRGIPRSLNTPQFKMPSIQNRLQIGAGRNQTRPSLPGVRKDVGIKFLDQPVSLPDSKKKKKSQEPLEQSSRSKENDKSNIDQTPTHYAAGLADYVPPSPAVHSAAYNENIAAPQQPPQQQQQDRSISDNENQTGFQSNLPSTSIPPHQLPPMLYSQNLDAPTAGSNVINEPVDQPAMHTMQPQPAASLIAQQQQPQPQIQHQQPPNVRKNVTTLTREQADELRTISKNYPVDKEQLLQIISL